MRRAQRWMAGALATGLGGFLILLVDARSSRLADPLDVRVNEVVSTWAQNGWPVHQVGAWLSLPGDSIVDTVATVAAAAWMLGRRQPVLAAWCVLVACTAGLTSMGLKMWVARQRPGVLDEALFGYSFPSGHTLGATATVGAILVLLTEVHVRTARPTRPHTRRLWAATLATWATLALVTATGRVLTQRHWTSDVVASGLLGTALVAGLLLALSRRARGGDPGPTVPEPSEGKATEALLGRVKPPGPKP